MKSPQINELPLKPEPAATITDNSQFTHDAFLGERVIVSQPKKGFRAGIDSVLLAAAVDDNAVHVLELGAGGGAVACCLLARLPQVNLHLVENNQQALTLLVHNIAQNKFGERTSVINIDINAVGRDRKTAGLRENHFDVAIANPPYYLSETGTLAHEVAKAASNHMPAADLDNWVKASATSLKANGTIIFIMPASRLDDLLVSFTKRFGAISVLPILPREGEDAHRILVRATKGSKQPLRLLAPLILHEQQGHGFDAMADQIFKGVGRLHW